MPRDDTAFLIIRARGLRKAEKMLQEDQKFIRSLIQETIEETGLTAEAILQHNAPERTGRLRKSIMVTGRNRSTFRPNIRVGVIGAKSDEGYDYTGVTRFGRKAVEARSGFGTATAARTYNLPHHLQVGMPGVQRRPFRARMLKFSPGTSGSIYRRRVRAYRPPGGRDWVRTSQDEIRRMTDFNFAAVTREIEKILERPLGSTPPRRVGVGVRSRFGRFHT